MLHDETSDEQRARKLKYASGLRKRMTTAEEILWDALRNRRCGAMKFRRQEKVSWFVVDFLCMEFGLVVEVDGPIHLKQKEYDQRREMEIEKLGWKILRFTNDEVINHLDTTLERILQERNRVN